MRPLLARFAPVLVFLLGLLTGVALSALWAVKRLESFADNGPGGATRFGISVISRQLDLDPEQRARFAPLFARVEDGFAEMHREDLPKVRALIEGAAAEMRPGLTADQQAKMDELLARPRARWERFLGATPAASSSPESQAR